MKMSLKTTIAAIGCALWLPMMGQREVTVVDMETRVPIGGALMTPDNEPARQQMANYLGRVSIPAGAQTATFSHQGYDLHEVKTAEMADTVELMRTYMGIREVVVTGKKRTVSPYILKDISKLGKQMKQEVGVTAGVAFDFFNLFTAKKRKRTQERIDAIENY